MPANSEKWRLGAPADERPPVRQELHAALVVGEQLRAGWANARFSVTRMACGVHAQDQSPRLLFFRRRGGVVEQGEQMPGPGMLRVVLPGEGGARPRL